MSRDARGGDATAADPRRLPFDVPTRAIVVGLALAAAGLTCFQLSRPGLLFGVTADIGVYLGASVRLVHGALPYRDFAYLQPPGFVLLATPVASLSELIGTRDALAVLRLLTPLIAGANVILVGSLARRHGRLATLVACGVMAAFPAEFYALRSGMLEPLISLFCLVGARLLFDGDTLAGRERLALGGLAFGFAVSIKLPAIAPTMVVAALCLPAPRRRLLPFGGGALAGFALPTLPFVIAAPTTFYRQVLTSQLGRVAGAHRVPIPSRLGGLVGSSDFGGGSVAAIVTSLVLAAVVATAFTVSRQRRTSLEWFALGATIVVAAAQVVPAQYYPQYPAFAGPFLALLLGFSVQRLVGEHRASLGLGIAAAAAAALVLTQGAHIYGASGKDVAAAIDAVIPAGACAVSDSSEFLITADRFVARAPTCTRMTDPFGTTLVFGGGRSAATVAIWRDAFDRVDYIVLGSLHDGIIPLRGSLRAELTHDFRLVRTGGLLIYVRDGLPSASP